MFNVAMVLVMCSVANSPVEKIFSRIFNLLHETNLKESKEKKRERKENGSYKDLKKKLTIRCKVQELTNAGCVPQSCSAKDFPKSFHGHC